MAGEIQTIAKTDLFARLAKGRAAGITVVTPNRRLAQALAREFDRAQADKGRTVWETADILPVGSFVERLYGEALYAEDGGGLPQLLTAAQERAIWELVLAGQPLLSVAQTAANCADAWRLAQAWRIAGALEKFAGNEDTRAFAGWARDYAKRCGKEGFADAAVLPDLMLKRRNGKPKLLVAYGFDILPPQTADFLGAFEAVSCRSETKKSNSARSAFPSARHELEAAAQWARARLEGGAQQIGVVVPDLQRRRREVARVFSDALRPGWNAPGAGSRAMPFDISIGEPLGGCAIVDAAMGILELSFEELSFERVSKLVQSPFIAGAETEFAARARLDARLREILGATVSLPKLIGLLEGCPQLRAVLEKLFLKAKEKTAAGSPHDWARHFTALLEAAGFPGGRAPDPAEYQARAKFNEALGDFARIGLVTREISSSQALNRLRRTCADTLFQPETPDAPIEVLGILESAGLAFDCLWVSGLTEEAWPLAARANPFLPVALQKKAGIPEAAAETSLALDRRITAGWLGAAEEVVFSYPQKEKDRDLLASPLIAQVPEGKVELPALLNYREVLFSSRGLESIPDATANPVSSGAVRGGTRVLADQAACPFRAFARHRLGAEGLASPEEGLDAMQRGQLLHSLMAAIWQEVKTQEGLQTDLSFVISAAAEKAVKELNIEGRFADLEKKRLEKLAREWLEVERGRPPFEVVAIEQKRPIAIGGLEFSGRIDRMDRLADGSHALIDYKSGAQLTPQMWMGERPDEPQLPLYAVSAPEDIGAVAFAKLKTGNMRFMGFSRAKDAIPQVKLYQWDSLHTQWRSALEGLARQFAAGDARVDPKRGFATCRYCGLQPLCRVHERLSALSENGEEGGE